MKRPLHPQPGTYRKRRLSQGDCHLRGSRHLLASLKLSGAVLGIILTIILTQIMPEQAKAAITLANFTATYSPGQILVEWETATEIDTVGFYLQRSIQATSGFQRISEFIPAEGESVFGWFYNFVDTNITQGTTYYYVLEVINADNTSENYGPISVYAGPETLTPTVTSTPTSTQTFTPTGPTPTPSRTPTRTPTRTPSRTPTRTLTRSLTPYRTLVPTNTFVPTLTLTESPSPTFTATITPTLTLASLPALVYTLEPTSTETPTTTPVPSDTSTPIPAAEAQTQESFLMRAIRSGALARVALIVSVIAFWIILALGVYLYFQYRWRQ